MKIVIVTEPGFVKDEAGKIVGLLESGMIERVHIRKPLWSADAMRLLLNLIPADLHPLLSLHDHHGLASELNIGGIHLNSRNPSVPEGFSGIVSRSCHSIAELQGAPCDYRFLSPIFDSISKQGYRSNFTPAMLRQAVADGLIDGTTYALGGVKPNRLPLLADWGFEGAAMLGAAWGASSSQRFLSDLKECL